MDLPKYFRILGGRDERIFIIRARDVIIMVGCRLHNV